MIDAAEAAHSLGLAGFAGRILANAVLAPHTTWRIGGPAKLLAEPTSRHDVEIALSWAKEQRLPWRVMGNGSNLLVADRGVEALVLRLRRVLDDVTITDGRVDVGAGASFPALARLCARRGLQGIEFGTGIPGTVGGALVMNAGWHEFEIGSYVQSVEMIDVHGELQTLSAEACAFGYRNSVFRRGPRASQVIVGASLSLEPGKPAEIRQRLDHFAKSRKANQPTALPSCGSVFLKPEGDFAGRLIDTCGLKGLRVGDIEVSPLHANFFVNVGRGTAEQVLQLVEQVERRVYEACGVRLVREFEYWDS